MSTSKFKIIIHPETHLPTAISAAMDYEQEHLGNEENLNKTGPYHRKVYASEIVHHPASGEPVIDQHRVQVYHTKNSIIARPDFPTIDETAQATTKTDDTATGTQGTDETI